MRLHLVGLPHYDAIRENDFCAYSGKTRRFGAMLRAHGHELVLYAGPTTDSDCDLVSIIGAADRARWFGGPWDSSVVFDRWNPDDPCWTEMHSRAIAAIRERWQPGDAVAVVAGRCQAAIADAFPNELILEPFIGYEGVLAQSHRCYESNAWRSYVTAKQATDDLRWYDTVIPNAYGEDEFLPPRAHDGYLLFLGRATERKGLPVVRELAQRFKVRCAGQTDPQIDGAEYVGLVRVSDKAELLAGAAAVLAPTSYLEPFGGVAVEAQLAGAPAITTDYGAFPETVADDWRCTTLAEFIAAADRALEVDELTRAEIACQARRRWSTEAVAPLYDRWLRRLATLHGDGWYTAA